MKKAQMAGQIFIYILSIIIVALVLLYGYKAIKDFEIKKNEIELINFKNKLEKVVVKSTRYDDVNPIEVDIPGSYTKVCFVDTFNSLPAAYIENRCLCTPGCPDYNALICDAWKTTNTSNVFLIPLAEIPINMGPITVDGNGDESEDSACLDPSCSYLCVPFTRGKLNLILNGKGNRIFIESR